MKLGISSCLLGNMCRYNGESSRDEYILKTLSKYFEFVPYCPEEKVFGTPRDAIRLVEVDNKIKVETTNSKLDLTKELEESCDLHTKKIANDDLCGFVLKAKSPTCGLERVKVYEANSNMNEKKGFGLFAKRIKENYPYLPIEEEGRLHDPWLRENFLMQIFAYKDLYEFLNGCKNLNELVLFHTSYKYLVYAKSHKSYKDLGRVVANNIEKREFDEIKKMYEELFLEAISKKGSIKKTYNVLLHIFGYFKKLISKDEKEEILASINEYKEGIIPLIAVIKVINLYAKRFNVEYLLNQKFLNPYPKELALRSDLKAYK
jgi:uncharacterized protein YbgA (DUF1722 family)/uncharacterized protein YbbK (DUF523 family)